MQIRIKLTEAKKVYEEVIFLYKVYVDSKLIYDQTSDDMGLKITNPTLVEEANSPGSFTFVMPPNNKGYYNVEAMRSIIKIYRNEDLIFKGRPLSVETDFNNCKKIVCEGSLGFLHDIMYVDTSTKAFHGTPAQFLINTIRFYNANTDSSHHIELGSVDIAEDANDFRINYKSVYNIISDFSNEYDCNVIITYRDEVPVLYLRKGYDYGGARTIEFGKNLLDLSRTIDVTDIASVIIPRGEAIYADTGRNGFGALIDQTAGYSGEYLEYYDLFETMYSTDGVCTNNLGNNETKTVKSAAVIQNKSNDKTGIATISSNTSNDENAIENTESDIITDSDEPIGYVNIADVNNGSIYLTNTPLFNLYGRIEKIVDFEGIKDPKELLTLGKKWLTNYQFEDLTIEVSLADLSIIDGSSPFKILTQVRCVSEPHGMDRYFPVTKIETVLDDPSATKITLNKSVSTTLSQISSTVTSTVENNFGNGDKYGNTILQRAKNRARDLIRSCMGGYVTLVPDETGQYVQKIVISDQPDWEQSERFWEWNQNGLGYFKRDGDKLEDCGLALTMNGEIVADLITAGTMYADRIRGGSLVLGDYDNQSGRIEVRDKNGGVIGRWTNEGINTIGTVQCGSIDPDKKEYALMMKDGKLIGFKDGIRQGYLATSVPYYRDGYFDDEHYIGNGWVLTNDTAIALHSPIFGLSKEPYIESAQNYYMKGQSGTVKVVTSVWLNDDGTLDYSTKNIEFYNGIMTTNIE